MASAESYVPTAPTHYVWWFPGSPVKVHLDLQVVRRLKEQLQQSGPGAAQQEGLLFGRKLDGATEILDLRPADGRGIAEMIAALPKEQSKRALVGYYRTEPGDLLRLNDSDRALAEKFFPRPHQVFLVIQSTGFGPPNATFFFHDGDHRMADFAFLEFPLDTSLLTIEERDRMRRSQQAIAVSSPAETQLEGPPAPAPPRRPRRRPILKPAFWIPVASLIAAIGVGIGVRPLRERIVNVWTVAGGVTNRAPSAPASNPSPTGPSMGLHAQRQNGDLELTWNRESALIVAAHSGVISIEDGNSKRDISLNAAQVHSGSLLYSPSGDQITMQLTVQTAELTATETVMVVLSKHGDAPRTLPVAGLRTQAPPIDAEREGTVPRAAASRPFMPPEEKAAAPSIRLADAPPALSPRTVSPPPVAAPLATPPSVTAPPVVPTQTPPSATSRYQPPVAISKPLPRYPMMMKDWLGSPKTVEVKVSIDKDGKITQAEPIAQEGIARIFLDEAVKAARSWKFQPARLGDQPIASELVLRFVFKR
jgi:outer membrane biosynthesis protein TonB